MITASEIYWILKLDAIRGVLLCFSIFVVVSLIVAHVDKDADFYSEKRFRKRLVITVPIVALLIITTAMIPSTKQMAAIKIIPSIANSDVVGELSADAKELYLMGINAIKAHLTVNNKEKRK